MEETPELANAGSELRLTGMKASRSCELPIIDGLRTARKPRTERDPEVKAWEQKTLPVLEQHLSAAKQIASQVGVNTSKASAMSSQQ